MIRNPKITVLMSVYNGEKYLREAVDIILNQTFKDFEFIIINDFSTDRTASILSSFNDSRIKIINNEENVGLTLSLNKGLQIAKGAYIARQDAGDISTPDRLEKQVEFLNKYKDICLVGAFFYIINEKGRVLYKVTSLESNGELKRKLSKGNAFAHGVVMFRKKCVEKLGGYREQFTASQDYDLWLRFSEHYKMANIPEYLYKWRLNINSVSVRYKSKQDRYATLALELYEERQKLGKDRFQMFEKNGKKIKMKDFIEIGPEGKNSYAKNYNYWARILLHKGLYNDFFRFFIKALLSEPFCKDNLFLLLDFFYRSLILVLRKIKQIFSLRILRQER
jgi:glycosyltransferase involved in cell wall biosynthesis